MASSGSQQRHIITMKALALVEPGSQRERELLIKMGEDPNDDRWYGGFHGDAAADLHDTVFCDLGKDCPGTADGYESCPEVLIGLVERR